MKKFLLVFFVLASSFLQAFADYIPQSPDSIKHYGIGVVRINKVINIYQEKDENSEIVQKIYWDNYKNYNNLLKIPEYKTFVVFYPKADYAFLSVEDDDTVENEEEESTNWYLVCYDQENKLYGWVKEGESAKFYSWKDFIMFFGRKNGIILFDNGEEKKLYAKPDENSQVVDEWKYAKYIEPWFISGNWLMVKVTDYDNKQKTGYIRWRTEDGKLLLFVKFRN